MPSSYLIFNSMNFIKDVAKFSNEIVFNRYGELPKVFLMVDTLNGPINQWKWTDKGKIGHRLGFTSEFIAAERDSELIRDWLK